MLETGQGIYNEKGNVEALEGIIIDNTEAKQNLEHIKFINDHDSMTGLYNRRYFDKALSEFEKEKYLPVSVIVVDING